MTKCINDEVVLSVDKKKYNHGKSMSTLWFTEQLARPFQAILYVFTALMPKIWTPRTGRWQCRSWEHNDVYITEFFYNCIWCHTQRSDLSNLQATVFVKIKINLLLNEKMQCIYLAMIVTTKLKILCKEIYSRFTLLLKC